MIRNSMMLLLLAMMISSMAACNRTSKSAASAGLQVSLIPDADYPGSTLTVQITDKDDLPVTDVTVSVEGNMTHAGMFPVLSESVWDGADGSEDGFYTIPFRFTMLGDWIVTAKIEARDGPIVTQDFNVAVTMSKVTIEE